MDILLYVTITAIIGVVSCYRNGNFNFNEITVEDMQADIGDESLGDVEQHDIQVGNNLSGYYDETAFTKIVKELGLE